MMDIYSKKYRKEIRSEYLRNKSKKEKGKLLDETDKQTGLNRKCLIK